LKFQKVGLGIHTGTHNKNPRIISPHRLAKVQKRVGAEGKDQ
jgi:hypothetical protein